MVRYSREDALTQREFVLLLEGARKMKPEKALQTRFIIMTAGKMGFRSGEIAHMDQSWINKSDKTISVPEHDSCKNGQCGNEICGYCRNRVVDYLESNNTSIEEELETIVKEFDEMEFKSQIQIAKKRVASKNFGFDEIANNWWQPKTPASVRTVPFDFDTRLQLCVERFFDQYDRFPVSKATLNRRVKKAAKKSELENRIYPHSLRATAATTHAARDVSPYALMSVMGWRDMDTARKYISASDESAAIELRSKHR